MDFKCCVVTSLYVQTYYPGNPNRGAALLASYVWEHEADYWLGMTDEECKMKVGIYTVTVELPTNVHEFFIKNKVPAGPSPCRKCLLALVS